MATFLDFMNTRKFWTNILIMFLFALGLMWLIFASLSSYTKHGESIKVPDLRGMVLSEVATYLESRSLNYTVLDSSYNKDIEPEAVLEQDPIPGATVKENRRIYLTINAKQPPLVKIPEIMYASLRNAEVQLQSVGLDLGELKYVPDLAKNAVLDIRFKGVSIKTGTEVPKGTPIDLVLGNGLGDTRINVPQLVGKTFLEAKLTLRAYDLNLGIVAKDGVIKNEESAIVYKQNPDPGPNNDRQVTLGEPIDVFLREGTGAAPSVTFNEADMKPDKNPNMPAPAIPAQAAPADTTQPID
jgi:beta-lactam-binding protein with PASTA domain